MVALSSTHTTNTTSLSFHTIHHHENHKHPSTNLLFPCLAHLCVSCVSPTTNQLALCDCWLTPTTHKHQWCLEKRHTKEKETRKTKKKKAELNGCTMTCHKCAFAFCLLSFLLFTIIHIPLFLFFPCFSVFLFPLFPFSLSFHNPLFFLLFFPFLFLHVFFFPYPIPLFFTSEGVQMEGMVDGNERKEKV